MTILNVSDLTKQYKNRRGVFNFDLELKDKDILLLLGPNGAGKTTAFRGILGLTKVESGNVSANHKVLKKDYEGFMKQIGAMVSKPAFYEYLTGYEHLKMLVPYYENVDDNRVQEVLSLVGLESYQDDKVSNYSTGMRQRLDFARAILHKPSVLLLDEPFNGLDIETKAELKDRIKEMKKTQEIAVMISSHMVGDMESLANKVIIIYEGKCLFKGSMKEISATNMSLEEFYLDTIKVYQDKSKS